MSQKSLRTGDLDLDLDLDGQIGLKTKILCDSL